MNIRVVCILRYGIKGKKTISEKWVLNENFAETRVCGSKRLEKISFLAPFFYFILNLPRGYS